MAVTHTRPLFADAIEVARARSASRDDELALLAAVRSISCRVARPARISQRVFDAIAAADPEFNWVPAARRIAEALRMPWAEVVQWSAAPAIDQARAVLGRVDDADWFGIEQVIYALQLVARRLGVRSFDPGAYESERAALRQGGGAAAEAALPTANQIERIAGGWSEALALAGLIRRRRVGGFDGVRPETIVELIEVCVQAHGVEPSVTELEVFAKANGIPHPRRERGRRGPSYIEEWREQRRARGEPLPAARPKVVPVSARPDFSQPVPGFAREGERRKKEWTFDECVAAFARFMADPRRTERVGQRGYDQWRRRQADAGSLPWSSQLGRQPGGLTAVRAAAAELVRTPSASAP